ncbi:hypothetical protein ACI2KR_08170 [Pseudomonas luteola]
MNIFIKCAMAAVCALPSLTLANEIASEAEIKDSVVEYLTFLSTLGDGISVKFKFVDINTEDQSAIFGYYTLMEYHSHLECDFVSGSLNYFLGNTTERFLGPNGKVKMRMTHIDHEHVDCEVAENAPGLGR